MSETINIVGAGLAGSITAAALEDAGFEVRIFDDGDERSASWASSNLYIASWLKRFGSEEAQQGIAAIERLFGEHREQPFSRGIADAAKVWHIPQRHILRDPTHREKVVAVTPHGAHTEDDRHDGKTILCCGYRGKQLVHADCDVPEINVKVGHCYLLRGRLPEGTSRLGLVSPYTHEKLYQYDEDTIYYADSVAVKPDSYRKREDELKRRTKARLVKAVGCESEAELDERYPTVGFRVGFRPLMKGHDFGFVKEIQPGVYVLNGGGKNGMIAYARLATDLAEALS